MNLKKFALFFILFTYILALKGSTETTAARNHLITMIINIVLNKINGSIVSHRNPKYRLMIVDDFENKYNIFVNTHNLKNPDSASIFDINAPDLPTADNVSEALMDNMVHEFLSSPKFSAIWDIIHCFQSGRICSNPLEKLPIVTTVGPGPDYRNYRID